MLNNKFDWGEYLKLADFLTENSDVINAEKQASFRGAISRAYYGAYGVAWNKANNMGANLYSNGKDHSRVQDFFKNNGAQNLVKAATLLDRVFTDRKLADYKENEVFYKGRAQKNVKQANKIVSLL